MGRHNSDQADCLDEDEANGPDLFSDGKDMEADDSCPLSVQHSVNTVIATTKRETKINYAQSPKADCHASFSSSVLSVDGLNAPEVRLAV